MQVILLLIPLLPCAKHRIQSIVGKCSTPLTQSLNRPKEENNLILSTCHLELK